MEQRPTRSAQKTVVQPRSRVQRWSMLVAGIAVVCSVAVAFVWLSIPAVDSVTPASGTNDSTPTIVLKLRNADGLTADKVRIRLNGESVAASQVAVSDGVLKIDAGKLDDGTHRVSLATDRIGLLRQRVQHASTFVVDTEKPRLSLPVPNGRPIISQDRRIAFEIQTDPGAQVQLTTQGRSLKKTAGSTGDAKMKIKLADGEHTLTLTATDAVGNTSKSRLTALVDATKPRVTFSPPEILKTSSIRLTVGATDNAPIKVRATIEGYPDELVARPIAQTPKTTGQVAVAYSADAQKLSEDGWATARQWQIRKIEPISEGVHRMRIQVEDKYGNISEVNKTILVDSSETLGANFIGRGARGADVKKLQDKLAEEGYFTQAGGGKREYQNAIYGQTTTAAVRSFQNANGLAADGLLGDETLAMLTLKIVVDRAAHTLTLYRADEAVKTYRVAVGSPQYPTPAGDFQIVNLQKNPTWTPPDSDWAKDAKPIPPGPDNPLGTRWMGLDSPNVGIHGTNSPASLGYSVSHGCIRMSIPDVEEIFEFAKVGTPVTIV